MAQKALLSTRRASNRRDLLESLEHRQMMSTTTANFNFQPATSAVPAGFTADTGKAYSSQNGLTYGWNVSDTAWTRDRNTSANAEQDTLIHFGQSGAASKWEVAVANGTYNVSLMSGDASYLDSKYGIAVEGKTILSGTPTSSKKWLTGSGTVVVTDGKLTVTSAAGSVNNKLNSLKFSLQSTSVVGAGVPVPAVPATLSAYGSTSNAAVLKWSDSSKNESGFIIEQSLDNKSWGEIARVGANVTTFTATGLNASTKYYYRVKSYNAGGTSTPTTLETATTLKATAAKLSAVTGLSVTATSTTSAVLSWRDIAGETGYHVQRSTDNKSFADLGTTGANVTSFTDKALKAATKYYYRITAYNAGSTSVSSVAALTPAVTTVAIPKPTSTVAASVLGSSSAKVTWSDVAGETGYIIEKSTDKKNYTEAGRVGTNVTSYTATGLNASTSYTFRIKSYNAGGVSSASIVQTVKTSSAPISSVPITPPASTPPGGGTINIPNGNALSGVSVNGGTAADFTGALRDIGIKNVRLWYTVDWHSTTINKWYADRAAAYKAAGFKVMMTVIQDNPTDYATAKRFYTMLANDSGLRNSVDYWQIGNEPNIASFWSGTLSQYVNTNLKPGYEALHAKGETVVGAGPSWDVNVAKQLYSLGYDNYCDYAAFHPYADTAAQVLSIAAGAKAAFGNKPIMFTEWNISGHAGNTSGWVKELNAAAPGLAKIGALSYYFGMEVSSTHVGGGGLLNTNGSENTPYYNAMKDWLN